MRSKTTVNRTVALSVPIGAALLFPGTAHAYIGPGAGLGTIMVAVALLIGVALLVFGFVWYPMRRMLRKKKNVQVQEEDV